MKQEILILYTFFFFSCFRGYFFFGGQRSKNFVSISHDSCGALHFRIGFWFVIFM